MSDSSKPPAPVSAEPVSARIRARIVKAKRRFHANDNISTFIEPGELEALQAEVEGKLRGVLESLVIDTTSDHNTRDTAKRVAKMYLNEVFQGRYHPAPPVTEFPNAAMLNELMIGIQAMASRTRTTTKHLENSAITTSVTRFGEISPIGHDFKSLWQNFKCLI